MTSLSKNLEATLHRALEYANVRRHEFATLEHLLLALVDDRDAAAVMRACNVDLDQLRNRLGRVSRQRARADRVARWRATRSPTNSFQRVVQRAIVHVQTSGREEVTGANVLVGIFSERESHAAYFLHEQDMTRFDAVQYIAHGIAKRPGMSEPRAVRGADEEVIRRERREKARRRA